MAGAAPRTRFPSLTDRAYSILGPAGPKGKMGGTLLAGGPPEIHGLQVGQEGQWCRDGGGTFRAEIVVASKKQKEGAGRRNTAE